MRLAALAIALALSAPSTPAAAYDERDFCETLLAQVDAAIGNFDGMRSTTASYYIDGQPYFLALRELPDARTCYISVGAEPVLTCEFYTGIMPRAEELYEKLNVHVPRCIAKRITGDVRPSYEDATRTEFVTDEGIVVVVDNTDLFGTVLFTHIKPPKR
jgi:hypothetical protein